MKTLCHKTYGTMSRHEELSCPDTKHRRSLSVPLASNLRNQLLVALGGSSIDGGVVHVAFHKFKAQQAPNNLPGPQYAPRNPAPYAPGLYAAPALHRSDGSSADTGSARVAPLQSHAPQMPYPA